MADDLSQYIPSELLEALGLPIIKDRSDQALAIIRGRHISDPKLYEALVILAEQMAMITQAISPITKAIARQTPISTIPEPPFFASYVLTGTTVRLSWMRPPMETGNILYEVRFGGDSGNSSNAAWDLADFVIRTTSTTVDLIPFTGLRGVYRIKTINSVGVYSDLHYVVVVNVIRPGLVTINSSVIDNNILLSWNDPEIGSFNIEFYSLYKDNVFKGTTKGTFISFFEVISGTYKYTIIPVDIADNVGEASEVLITVNQPPDYALQDSKLSDLDGTRWQVGLIPGPKLLASWAPQTWEQHFMTRAWINIKAQQNAGYPIYIQPTAINGYYEEIVDYGTVFSNIIASITWQTNQIFGDTDTNIRMAHSIDGVTWTPLVEGASQFIPEMRYLYFHIDFIGSDDKSLMELFNLRISLDVKRENDGGDLVAIGTDVGGTKVFFNKPFKDIESITATADAIEPLTVIYDFVDIPDPKFFYVYVLDSTGNRVTYLVSWKARGIV
jgi:hypothetical protein